MQIEFDWDPAKAAIKHGEARHSIRGGHDGVPRLACPLDVDTDHDADEERWVTLGQASTGHLLIVHTWAEINPDRSAIRIVSTRRRLGTKRARIAKASCHERRI